LLRNLGSGIKNSQLSQGKAKISKTQPHQPSTHDFKLTEEELYQEKTKRNNERKEWL